ncbi:glycoside hydrolase family 5 protein [Shinella sp. CPCC 100929]|uniref:Glycoside hydrolase family 5 protein n=1 Tax=Shinella lacus TaxID=2654216 RepID=A0ABT1R059_9HYPH|nr:glycoside hydrolase family 5 protein [Shinella lacus]
MRAFRPLVLLVIMLLGAAGTALAADLPSFRRGINFARLHSLPTEDPEKAGAFLWPPFQGPLARIKNAELRRLRAVGFDFIRLPVAPAPFLSVTQAKRRVLTDALLDTVRRLQKAGFGVLIDAHPNHSDPNWSAPKILADAKGAPFRDYAEWLKQLAAHLRDLPAEKTALGLMNEPQQECQLKTANDWINMQPLLYAAVRETAPDLALVLTTGCYSSPEALPQLDMAPFDGNTLVDVHYYRPYPFTHQGLPFANEPLRYMSGIAYPGTGADSILTLARTMQLIAERRRAGDNVPDDALDQAKATMANYYDDPPIVDDGYVPGHFAAMRKWVEAEKIAPSRLIIGEFGVARQPEDFPEIPGRYRWLADVRKAAEDNGFGWALWDYNAGDGYPGFGLVFDNESRKIDADAIEALGLDRSALRD